MEGGALNDHVGFTGTRHGMTKTQRDTLFELLRSLRGEDGDGQEFHHGACRGSDAGAARVAKAMGYVVHAHPSWNVKWTDNDAIDEADVVHNRLDELTRNQAIVQSCHTIIAAPLTAMEERRSGTWATVRRARKANRRVIIMSPSKEDA
jgi:hypothetical protein